jgi:DsbC/DsbD-like thiol-disulfide interchange protein
MWKSMSAARILALSVLLGLGAAAPAVGEAVQEPAAASPWVQLHASRARLVASKTSATGGARLAGLEIVLDDGWKTYWRMPGDAGVPPQHEWKGSTNVAGIKVLYPAPMRMSEAGGQVIGYKHAALFPIEVTQQDPAKPATIKLALELGICKDICVPVTANFELALPPAGKTAQKDAIAAAIERVPRSQVSRRASDPELLNVSLGEAESGARLAIQAAFGSGKGADIFVEAPEGLYVPMLRKESPAADGTLRFTADLSPDLVSDLKGKTLTLTLVSDTGATEAQWKAP